VKEIYILYDSSVLTFWKKQHYIDRKKEQWLSGFWGREEGREEGRNNLVKHGK
jgi:hypothetical protein